jgi:hypothetical protein
MKTFLLFAILFCSSIENHGVYICTGPNAYAYHKKKHVEVFDIALEKLKKLV